MNSVNFKAAKLFTKSILFVSLFISTAMAWDVDFSRRQIDFNQVTNQNRMPASAEQSQTSTILSKALDIVETAQDIVIMNTEKGFVPETLRLRQGSTYRIHVVNVNSKEKNVSFVADAFSEHHNTIFGQQKTFQISPKVDGVFSYQCPETSAQGKFVVYPVVKDGRKPASK